MGTTLGDKSLVQSTGGPPDFITRPKSIAERDTREELTNAWGDKRTETGVKRETGCETGTVKIGSKWGSK